MVCLWVLGQGEGCWSDVSGVLQDGGGVKLRKRAMVDRPGMIILGVSVPAEYATAQQVDRLGCRLLRGRLMRGSSACRCLLSLFDLECRAYRFMVMCCQEMQLCSSYMSSYLSPISDSSSPPPPPYYPQAELRHPSFLIRVLHRFRSIPSVSTRPISTSSRKTIFPHATIYLHSLQAARKPFGPWVRISISKRFT